MALPDLWPHQQSGIDRAREAMRAGHRRIVLVSPTGSGKSRLGTELVAQCVAKGKRAVWSCHRTELVDQAAATLTKAGLRVGVISAGSALPADPDAPVQVASLQTMIARGTRPPADLLVPDECHHLAEDAETWASVLDAYPNVATIGLTATPERGNGTGLDPIFTHLIQVVSVRDLTMSGHLVPCKVIRPDTYLKKRGDTGAVLAQDPVEAYCEHTPGQQGFLFAPTIEEAKAYAERLEAAGHVSRAVHQGTPADERRAILDGFRAGRIRMLCNVFVFTEGTDLPAATVCILARGCSTAGTYLQMVGRVLRVAKGKTEAVLLDLPGVSWLHGLPEDDRVWSLKGRACIVASAKCKVCGVPVTDWPCPSCGYDPEPADPLGATADTTIVNAKLSVIERLLAHGPEQQQQTFVRWMVEAALKGRSPGTVIARWKKLYGVPPSWKWYGQALKTLRGDLNPTVVAWAEVHQKRAVERMLAARLGSMAD